MSGPMYDAQTMRLFLEGKREGKISAVMELYADGYIDEETAAERLNMPAENFLTQYRLRKRPEKAEQETAGESDGEDIE